MPRYIDADAFEKRIEEERTFLLNRGQSWAEHILVHHLLNILYEQPTVDAAEVVRCKDCKWYKSIFSWNGNEHKICVREPGEPPREPDDYCSYGERREDAK